MTQIGEGIAITTIAQEDDDETHHAGVMLCYPNGKPYTKHAPLLFSADGSDGIGLFNFEGQWVNFMLAPGAEVTYEIGEDVTDEIAATRDQIKISLGAGAGRNGGHRPRNLQPLKSMEQSLKCYENREIYENP